MNFQQPQCDLGIQQWTVNYCKYIAKQFYQVPIHNAIEYYLSVHRGQQIDEIIDLPDVMFNPGRMRQPHFLDEIMLALERQPMQQADAIVTAGVCTTQN